ncbi:MAG: tetratricopeptide repeat protein [Candidatus Omnitrophica bacterium]|nr:tetratricopeptide repeat protein [Candidatus Omnitrophota bacterium]MCF7894334.1 tetratricopeptide repeat protein [Candidatus Omnitrophota bacterium]
MSKIIKITLVSFLVVSIFSPFTFAKDDSLAQEKFQIASGAFSDEFYQAALSLFKNFIKQFPQNPLTPKAKLYIAKCFYHQQKYSQGLAKLKELKKEQITELKDPIDYWLAKIFFEKKDFSNCLKYIKKITENSQSKLYQQAKYLQSLAYIKTKQLKKAKSSLEKIIKESEKQDLVDASYQSLLQIYSENNNFYKIISSTKTYLKNNPQTEIKDRIYFYLADANRKKNNLKEALGHYKKALATTTNTHLRDLIYRGMGLTFLAQKNLTLAKRTIDKIVDDQLRLFLQGLYYFNINDQIQALETFSFYLDKYPQGKFLAQSYLKKGDILYEMGRINDSLSAYSAVLKKFSKPGYSDIRDKAHYGLAWCYLKNNNFKKAIAEFKETLEYSDDPAVKMSSRIQMADAYQESKQYQKALDIYNQTIKDYPNTLYADYIQFQIGMIFIKKNILDKALLAFRNLTKNFPNSKLIPEAEYYLAVGYFSQNKYKKAEGLLNNLINKHPNSGIIPEAEYLYAKCLFNQKKYNQALEILQQITRKYKNLDISELVYIDIGLTYLNLEKFDKAKDTFRKFLKIYPNSEYTNTANFYLGGICEKETNFKQAEKYYRKVIENPRTSFTNQEALLALGHLAWNQGDLNKAKEYFKKGAKYQTSFGLKSKLYLAKVYQQDQQTDKALKLYQQLIDSQSNIARIALTDKAFLLKEEKKYQKAIQTFKQAIKAGINSPKIRFALGICLEKKDLDQKAMQQYFKLIYTYPKNPKDDSGANYKVKAYFRIAKIHENKNNLDQAKKVYQKIIDLGIKESKIAKVRLEKLKDNH